MYWLEKLPGDCSLGRAAGETTLLEGCTSETAGAASFGSKLPAVFTGSLKVTKERPHEKESSKSLNGINYKVQFGKTRCSSSNSV